MVVVQGQVLNQTSAWWMQHTEHITPNALLCIPDPNVAIMKKCKVLPIEFVVRGFMTGVYIYPENLCVQPSRSLETHTLLQIIATQ